MSPETLLPTPITTESALSTDPSRLPSIRSDAVVSRSPVTDSCASSREYPLPAAAGLLAGLLTDLLAGLVAEGEALERREKRRMSAAAESESPSATKPEIGRAHV